MQINEFPSWPDTLGYLFILFSNPGSKLVVNLFGFDKIPYISEITGFFLTVTFLFTVGLFVKNLLGKKIMDYLEEFLHKIPIVSMVYKTIKQITASLGDPKKQSFKKVVIIIF